MSKALHDEIMNISAATVNASLSGYSDDELKAYKIGHRDARHAAAELAINADDTQAELNAARALLREVLEGDKKSILHYEVEQRVRAHLDACDKPGAQHAS